MTRLRGVEILLAFLFTLLTFTALDVVWIYFVVRGLYSDALGDFLLDGFRTLPAVLLYVVLVVSITYFCTIPGVKSGNVLHALMNGLFLGIATYATYSLTCWAVLEKWTWQLAVLDIAWGGFLVGTSSLSGAFFTRCLRRPRSESDAAA